MSTTSAGVVAAIRAALKSFFMRARARLGQHLHVRVTTALGRGDEEDESAGPSLAPQSMPSTARPNERGFGDRGAAGVRDADAAGQAGRHLGLAGPDIGEEDLDVGAATALDETLREQWSPRGDQAPTGRGRPALA
jgi:hypothetical protein